MFQIKETLIENVPLYLLSGHIKLIKSIIKIVNLNTGMSETQKKGLSKRNKHQKYHP